MKKTTDKYICAAQTLLKANQAVNQTTGEVVELSPETKLVYFYMRDEYVMHRNYGNRSYSESWERIFATVCPCAPVKRKKISKQLTDIGLVVVVAKKSGRKTVKDVTEITGWEFINNQLDEFLSEPASKQRKSGKEKRIADWKADKQAKGEWTDYKKEADTIDQELSASTRPNLESILADLNYQPFTSAGQLRAELTGFDEEEVRTVNNRVKPVEVSTPTKPQPISVESENNDMRMSDNNDPWGFEGFEDDESEECFLCHSPKCHDFECNGGVPF